MDAGGWIRGVIASGAQLVWPRLCEVCGRRLTDAEEVMCLHCELEMPLTGLHLTPDFNIIHQRLAPHPPVERAAALFYYLRGDRYTALIHHAKYDGRPGVMRLLGRRYGLTLRQAGFTDGIDLIEAVPMHWFKELRRGYNQTDWLAAGLSEATGIEVGDHLRVTRRHSSQTRMTQSERWANAMKSYRLTAPDELRGRHILLIDDVITTGATISTCARIISDQAEGARISVAALGLTRLR